MGLIDWMMIMLSVFCLAYFLPRVMIKGERGFSFYWNFFRSVNGTTMT